MAKADSHVTIQMAASLDGFIAAYKSGMVELRYEMRGRATSHGTLPNIGTS